MFKYLNVFNVSLAAISGKKIKEQNIKIIHDVHLFFLSIVIF